MVAIAAASWDMPRKAKALLDDQRTSFRKALAAGVKMAMGTDLGSFGHGQNAGELAYLVEAGMTPMQAIVAATRMGAQCMGLGSEVGILREGMALASATMIAPAGMVRDID